MKKDLVNYDNYVGYKVKLDPTEEQKKIFIKYFGICRYVYNLGIDIEDSHIYDHPDNNYLNFKSLNKIFTYIKNNDEKHKWLSKKNLCDATTMKLILKDVEMAYKLEKKSNYGHAKYKTKKNSKKQFPSRPERMTIYENEIFINRNIGKVKYYNSYGDSIIGTGNKSKEYGGKYLHFINPRVIFNGINYYLTFSLPKDQSHQVNSYWKYSNNEQWQQKSYSKAIGIDVGLRKEKWMVDSTGYTLERPDNSKYYKKLKTLHKKLDRQYEVNKNREPRLFKDRKSPKNGQSKNMQKTIAKINKYYKKITNRRQNTVYNYCNRLLDLKPKAVVMESLQVHKLMIFDNSKRCNDQKNKMNHLIQDAAIYDSMRIIERKMMSNGIQVIYADDQYPSSQLCSNCGHRQNIGRKETYVCPECGTVINRDYNAALNLAKLADLFCPVERLS